MRPNESPPAPPTPARAYPYRALIFGTLGVVFLCALTPYNDYKQRSTPLYGNHLPAGALALLTLFSLAINPVLRRFAPRIAFSSGELLVFWVMMTVGAGLASSGLWRWVGVMAVSPAYFASSGAEYLSLFTDAPRWFLLSRDPDDNAVKWFYYGLPRGESVPYLAWLPVVANWGVAFACVAAFSLGLCILFREQWIRRERLSFPLVQVPLQLAQGGSSARNVYLWAGVAFVFTAHLFSTLHHFYPSLPGFPDQIGLDEYQTTAPWNALGLPPLKTFFAIIGATYLLPGDISLSLWSIYVVLHVFRVVRYSWGMPALSSGPLNHEHALGTGAFLALFIYQFWIARHQWGDIWRAARFPKQEADADRPLSARAALGLAVGGMVGLITWLCVSGVLWYIAVPLVLLYVLLIFVLTRFVAESGLLFLDSTFMPTQVLALFGTGYFNPVSAGVSLQHDLVLLHYPTEHVMPAMANAYALAEQGNLRPRAVTVGIGIALVAGFVTAALAMITVCYRFGAVTMENYTFNEAPTWSMDRALEYVRNPLPLHANALISVGVGVVLTALSLVARTQFVGWPFSPIGLAMGSTWAMDAMYYSIFLGWLCRSLILYLGGIRFYHTARPLFLGLLLGDGLYAGFSVLWGISTGIPMPPFFPTS